MTISNELMSLLISAVGAVLWYFVVTMIKDLKEQGIVNTKMLIAMEKELLELRFKLENYGDRLKKLEEKSD